MARGFLSGIGFGAVVAGVGLVTASQLAGTVEMRLSEPEPEAEAVRVPPGSEFNRERPESKPVLPQSEERPEGTAPPTAPAAEGGGLAPPVPDTRPAVAPEAAAVDEPGLTAPEAGTARAVNAGAEQAVLPAPFLQAERVAGIPAGHGPNSPRRPGVRGLGFRQARFSWR